MVERMYKKGLVVGIIILFVGMGVQPALAVENKVSTDKVEDLEDCDCQEIDDEQLGILKKYLNRFESNIKKLSLLFKDNSEIANEYEELTNSIQEMNIVINSDIKFPILCEFFTNILESLGKKSIECLELINHYNRLNKKIPVMFLTGLYILLTAISIPLVPFYIFFCNFLD